MEDTIYKDVIIIGNGPSAITLSYILAGNWPYYNGLPHPTKFLQHRLEENNEYSLLEQDLCYLSEGLEGRSLNPISVLFDALNHPAGDLGLEHPSVISWKCDPEKLVDHVVIGKGVPGGSWQKMDGSTLTISLGSWMELPNLNIREWDAEQYRIPVNSTEFMLNTEMSNSPRNSLGSVRSDMDIVYPEHLSRLHRHSILIENPKSYYNPKKNTKNRRGNRYRTQPVTFEEIQEVDEEAIDNQRSPHCIPASKLDTDFQRFVGAKKKKSAPEVALGQSNVTQNFRVLFTKSEDPCIWTNFAREASV